MAATSTRSAEAPMAPAPPRNVSLISLLASLEYAVLNLKTPVVIVLGHSRCGAVAAAVAGGELPGHLPRLVGKIAPAVAAVRAAKPDTTGDDLVDEVTRCHVKRVCDAIAAECPVLTEAFESGRTRLLGAFYDLAGGGVSFLDPPSGLSERAQSRRTESHGPTGAAAD